MVDRDESGKAAKPKRDLMSQSDEPTWVKRKVGC